LLTEWTVPESLEDAHEKVRCLVAEIEEIQAQLGDRLRRSITPFDDFWRWRQSAKWAWTNRLEELRLVKQWIREQQPVCCPHCGEKVA
jgi:hypothetical protein